jgi:ketosteroid isomerase-like protein
MVVDLMARTLGTAGRQDIEESPEDCPDRVLRVVDRAAGAGRLRSPNMSSVSDLLAANLHDVFGNRDAATRRVAIERTFTEDVTFTDPEGSVQGWDAIEEKARDLLEKSPPAFVFAEDGRRYASSATGALGWTFGPADGEPAARGIDMITVRDGRIATLVTIFAA